MTRQTMVGAKRASVSALALLGVLAVAGCTSGTTTGDPASRPHSVTTVEASPTTVPVTPVTSTTQSGPSSTSSATPPADTSATARALLASAVHVDADGFQTGSDDPSVPARPMPGTVEFTTPSRNIRCTMIDEAGSPSSSASLTCAFESFDFVAPPKPASCHHDWTADFGLSANGVVLGMCLGDEEVAFSSRVLPYGDAIQALGIGCHSSSAALTCLDVATGHGFSASKQRFVRF